jgi:hypothetical protein
MRKKNQIAALDTIRFGLQQTAIAAPGILLVLGKPMPRSNRGRE